MSRPTLEAHQLAAEVQVLLHARITLSRTSSGHTVSGHGCKGLLWAIWAIQKERGHLAFITGMQIAELAGCSGAVVVRAMQAMVRDRVITNLTSANRRHVEGSQIRINWERLIELIPKERAIALGKKNAA